MCTWCNDRMPLKILLMEEKEMWKKTIKVNDSKKDHDNG